MTRSAILRPSSWWRRIRCARQGQSRQAELRLPRRGHPNPSRGGAVQPESGHQAAAHPLSRRRARHDRDGRRRHPIHRDLDVAIAAADPGCRDAQLPDLPTVAEQGFPGFEAIQWIGLLTTAGTPKDVIERINGELNRALRDPDLIAKFAQQGLTPAGGTPADFQRTIATDLKNWTETAHAANITAQ